MSVPDKLHTTGCRERAKQRGFDGRVVILPHVPETSRGRGSSSDVLRRVVLVVVSIAFVVALWALGCGTPAPSVGVAGFDHDHEVTPCHLASLRDPVMFVGLDANLDPDR
jgi:hypothetical protein